MRRGRLALLSVALCGVVTMLAPSVSAARYHDQWRQHNHNQWRYRHHPKRHHHRPPRHNYGLTIAATPNPIGAGEGVLIYGKLVGSDVANQRIVLYHRITPQSQFTPITVTRTNSFGFYEIARAEGIVESNRSWFALGPGRTHSRTINEYVFSAVTLAASTTTVDTGTPVQFSGTVTPAHPDQRVLLQKQVSDSGDGWQTIGTAVTGSDSSFTLTRAFLRPGSYTVRALFPRDPRNLAGQSDPVTITVAQPQNPSFTIAVSAPVISDGQSETISGTLFMPGSTTTPRPSVPVILYGSTDGGPFRALAATTTGSDGTYSFTQAPQFNIVYRVLIQGAPPQSTGPRPRKTADVPVGVQDVVSIGASATTAPQGGTVTISGTVTPDKSGRPIYLQRLDATGHWQVVAVGTIKAGSTYSFQHTFGQPGTVQLRTKVPGGPLNLSGASTPVTFTVSGVAPATSLPPAQ
jgi:hypothetical protein